MFRRLLPYIMSGGWGICVFLMFFYMAKAQTSVSLLSPWQTIPNLVVYITALSLFLLGFLIIFSRFPTWVVLLFIVVQTFVMHSYLPLSHELFFGADGWRHIASVERLWQGLPFTDAATIVTGQSWFHHLDLGVVAYSHFWGLLLLARVLGVSFIAAMAWLGPLMWSLVIPSTLFILGKELGSTKRTALIFSFGALIPFALVAGGSFTLPNSLGFVIFLPSLIMVVRRLKTGSRRALGWLVLYGLFLLTGYTLYAIIFLLVWGIGEVLLWQAKKFVHSMPSEVSTFPQTLFSGKYRYVVNIFLLSVLVFSIPLLEVVVGYSHFPQSPSVIFSGTKQFVGNLTGFYVVFGPRPHAIATGNIMLNQTPSYAFVANLLTEGRYWLLVVSVGMWMLIVLAVIRGLRSQNLLERWLSLITIGLFGSYFLGRYILQGEQILSRRLDIILAFVNLAVLVGDGAKRFQALATVSWYRLYVIGTLAMIAVFGAAVYSLGPTDKAMSVSEYQAAEYIGQQEEKFSTEKHCVVGDTYPLLALEALSAKRIVGGGFPIDQYFEQQELRKFYTSLAQIFFSSTWQEALRVTGAKQCWFVGAIKHAETQQEPPYKTFGTIGVWKFPLK